ncbi:MAG TPA: MFS transporter [Candidatus Methylomirabilis sp.]
MTGPAGGAEALGAGAPPAFGETRPPIYTRAFLVTAFANLLFFLSLNGFNLLPLYIKHLHGTEAQIGFIMGMNSLASILFQPLAGVAIDRAGPKHFLRLGGAICLVATAGFLASDALNTVFPILRFLHGVGFSFYFTANFILVAESAPAGRRAEALGVFGATGLVSMALAPALGELVIVHFGYPAFFWAALVLGAGCLAVTAYVPVMRPAAAAGGGLRVRHLFRGRRVRASLAVACMFGLALGTIFVFIPTYARSVGIPRVRTFYLFYTGAAIAVRFFGGRFMDALGPRRIIPPSLGLQALANLVLVFLGSSLTLGLAGFLGGVAHGFLYPSFSVLVVDLVAAEHRGKMVGLFSSVIGLGATLGAMILGVVAEAWGYPAIYGVAIVATLIGLVVFIVWG